jgi:hypothetical protein
MVELGPIYRRDDPGVMAWSDEIRDTLTCLDDLPKGLDTERACTKFDGAEDLGFHEAGPNVVDMSKFRRRRY